MPPQAGRHSGWVSGRISRQVHALESRLVHESDSLIACSVSMAEEITRTLRAVRGGNDRDSQRNRLQPLAVRAPPALRQTPELLFFGRLGTRRRATRSPRLPRIRRTHPGTTLTIAGDGTQRARLVEVARNHRLLKAVRFLGEVDHDELLRLLHRADAAVLPSHHEPFRHRRAGGGGRG